MEEAAVPESLSGNFDSFERAKNDPPVLTYCGPGPRWGTVRKKMSPGKEMSPGKVCKSKVMCTTQYEYICIVLRTAEGEDSAAV